MCGDYNVEDDATWQIALSDLSSRGIPTPDGYVRASYLQVGSNVHLTAYTKTKLKGHAVKFKAGGYYELHKVKLVDSIVSMKLQIFDNKDLRPLSPKNP
jgi:hypothetical protein